LFPAGARPWQRSPWELRLLLRRPGEAALLRLEREGRVYKIIFSPFCFIKKPNDHFEEGNGAALQQREVQRLPPALLHEHGAVGELAPRAEALVHLLQPERRNLVLGLSAAAGPANRAPLGRGPGSGPGKNSNELLPEYLVVVAATTTSKPPGSLISLFRSSLCREKGKKKMVCVVGNERSADEREFAMVLPRGNE
jgi:hypothetical protein